jgi:hypothetical protein
VVRCTCGRVYKVHTCVYVYMHICVCMYIYIYISYADAGHTAWESGEVYVWAYLSNTYVFTCVYVYVYIHTPTYICIYTHIYIIYKRRDIA